MTESIWRRVGGDVTTPEGFFAWAASRPQGSPLAMALIWSDRPAQFAGMFTQNAAQAAPVVLTRGVSQSGISQAAVVNSGNANALTGPGGLADAEAMRDLTAAGLGVDPALVAVASTGVIGVPLPMDAVAEGIAGLTAACRKGEPCDGAGAARAILTTDTRPKTAALEVELSTGTVRVGLMAKGSGMIHPNMATMLVFITTDARVSAERLDALLRRAVERSFHRLSVDGDTSTNDMVLIWANGASGVRVDGDDLERFGAALTALCVEAARMIAADGEGARHLITARVAGAVSEADAALKARAIVSSALVKAAVYGGDPNWGRVLAAVGTVGVPFRPETAALALNGLPLFERGQPLGFDEAEGHRRLLADEVVFNVELGQGEGRAEAWGCDLTEGYVDINAHYRS